MRKSAVEPVGVWPPSAVARGALRVLATGRSLTRHEGRHISVRNGSFLAV
jgi:hypothetical protein